ncbi:RDD family protein [Kitasatospora sp. DSM 101779]|uniref:RDD family protein n=1 Tax=Kitasatospora sp. DSM 101779 TaxID=2853165 RepID=UPI0021DA8881|nr:RDD family protein [Kitasatospora sp. DSM 101779]MCU7824573.1 RDD family protein [Kitasatospora sp. DSM 101779]
MTDRPNGGAADTAVGPMPGYYPDPSIPGFVRYWGGTGWVPGTTRPAPAEGEVLEPPRIVSRQTPPLAPPTTAPPTAVPQAPRPHAPVPQAPVPPPAGPGPSAAAVPAAPGEAGVPTPATPSLPDWPSPPLSASDTQTGPVYFDETSAGASFVMAAHAEVELRPRADVEPLRAEQPALRPVPPALVPSPFAVPPARSVPSEALPPAEQPPTAEESEERIPAARSGGSGWQADPGAQHGLLETGAAPRWVSWGVLPTGAEADAAAAGVDHVAAPPSFPAPAPVRAVHTLQKAPVPAAATAAPEARAAEVHATVPEPPVVEEPETLPTLEAAPAGEPRVEPAPGSTVGAESAVPAAAETAETAETGEPAPAAPPAERSEPESGEQPHAAPEPDGHQERVSPETSATVHRPEAARSATARPAPTRPAAARPAGARPAAARPAASRVPEARPAEQTGARAADRPAPGRRPAEQVSPGQRPSQQTAAGQRPAAAARKAVPKPVPLQSAGLGRRLAARIVDSLLVLVVAAAAGVPLGTAAVAHVREKLDQARTASALAGHEVRVWLVDGVVLGKVGVLIGVLVVFGVLYEVLPTTRTGQTFGKRLVRIRVVAVRGAGSGRGAPPSFGRSLVRWVVRQLSVLMPIGLLWPLFDRRTRRGWQDRAAATRVVKG